MMNSFVSVLRQIAEPCLCSNSLDSNVLSLVDRLQRTRTDYTKLEQFGIPTKRNVSEGLRRLPASNRSETLLDTLVIKVRYEIRDYS